MPLAATPPPNVPALLTRWLDPVPPWLVWLLQFKTYFALFLGAAALAAILTPIYIVLARRLGWVDRPGGRKRHDRPTATMGGLVVFAVVFLGAAVALRLENRVGLMLREHLRPIYALLLCTAAMVGLGIIDDRAAVRPKIKLIVQTLVAIFAVLLGYRIEAVTLPATGSLPLPVIGVLLSLVWIVGITNAINLTDGLDGLAAGIGFLAATVNALAAIWLGNYYMAVMMCLLAGSLAGFLRWNFHPARVFLGDTGSLGLGMFLALSSLHAAQKAHTVVLILVPLFALGYPIFDTLLAVARRMVRGQPLFAGDRDHIHHRLLDRGASPSRAAIQIYVVSAVLCLACVAAITANHLALGLAIVGVLAMAIFGARFLGYLEWGGWATRWHGRDETKILHAAAQLARLKIAAAGDPAALLRALVVFAGEIGCASVTLQRGDQALEWQADDAAGPGRRAVESAEDGLRLRFGFATDTPVEPETANLLDELARAASDRATAWNTNS